MNIQEKVGHVEGLIAIHALTGDLNDLIPISEFVDDNFNENEIDQYKFSRYSLKYRKAQAYQLVKRFNTTFDKEDLRELFIYMNTSFSNVHEKEYGFAVYLANQLLKTPGVKEIVLTLIEWMHFARTFKHGLENWSHDEYEKYK